MFSISFLDNAATIDGPGGNINIGAGSGIAEEGLDFEPTGDANTMTIGADGMGQHAMSADRSGTITVRTMTVSPVNAQLQDMLTYQRESSANWGRNRIVISNPARGDILVASHVAFAKQTPYKAGKDPGVIEWTFHAIRVSVKRGPGLPEDF